MLKYIKRLFGIKPTEAKVEVAPVQEVIPEATPEPVRINVDTAGNVGIGTVNVVEPVAVPVVEPVVESTPPVVETTTEEVAPVVPEKTKKPAAKKPRAKKSTK